MLYFSRLFDGIAFIMAAFTVWMIVRFDRPLIPMRSEVIEFEHALLWRHQEDRAERP